MNKLRSLLAIMPTLAILTVPTLASAHVVVKPAQANIGEFVTFTVGVPNEKDIDVTGLKLDIPEGLNYVAPTVKSGWTIATDKTGQGETAVVKSITWTGGTIPAGQRDDFTFAAQVPAKAAELQWKAYQTYSDGTTVSWDQKPTATEKESENAGPYSVTKVVNDLASTKVTDSVNTSAANNTLPVVLSLIAIVVSVGGLIYKKK